MDHAEAPLPSNASLSFCSAPEYEAKGCCSVQDDHKIAAQFQAYNISDTTCAAVVKQILCSVSKFYQIVLSLLFFALSSTLFFSELLISPSLPTFQLNKC
jgi:hypothetical protein